MKNILIINGHPDKESYNFALMNAYKKGVLKSNFNLDEIIIRDLKFNPNLQYGYRKRTELEPDLVRAQEKIIWAQHLVLVSPVCFGGLPALFTGVFDITLLPGFSFAKLENSVWWTKLLKGRSARVICTLDQPSWYYSLINKSPSHKSIKKLTFQFCGIKPVKITSIGPLRLSSEKYRKNWLSKIEKLGSYGL